MNLAIRPAGNAAVTVTSSEFFCLPTLVADHRLETCHLSFGEPVRCKAIIYSLSFDETLTFLALANCEGRMMPCRYPWLADAPGLLRGASY